MRVVKWKSNASGTVGDEVFVRDAENEHNSRFLNKM
jgi:hypothetical protein